MYSKFDAKRMRPLAAATALALVLTLGAGDSAHADRSGGRNGAHVQRQKPRAPANYTRHTEFQRTEHGHTRSDTWTGENGKSVTRDAEVINDRDAQTRTRDVQWTGPNGPQATRTDVTQRTDDGSTRTSTATGAKGGTVERDVVATRDQEKASWVRDVTMERTPRPAGN